MLATLEDRLGVSLPAAIKSEIMDLTDRIYTTGKQEVISQVGMKLTFSMVDRKAINSLTRQSVFWVGDHWNETLSEEIKQVLQDGLANGLSRDELATVLEEQFGHLVEKSKSYWEGFANHTVTRAREFGHTEAYVNAGIEYLEVRAVLDDVGQ